MDPKELSLIFTKAEDTLEVLMCKLGLKDQFEAVISNYEMDFLINPRETL